MALRARNLIDTSAAARMRVPVIAGRLEPLITGGLVGTFATFEAEALYSAHDPGEYEQLHADRRRAYEYVPTNDVHWQRALDAKRALARSGRHRAVGIADLLTAVLAAEHGMTIVHYAADFRDRGRGPRVRSPMGRATRKRLAESQPKNALRSDGRPPGRDVAAMTTADHPSEPAIPRAARGVPAPLTAVAASRFAARDSG